MRYLRYLYTLRFPNPTPEERIESLTVRVDPESESTLALLAVTVVRPVTR